MRLLFTVIFISVCSASFAQSPSDSSRYKLHAFIESVEDAVQFQYDTKDNLNQSMDCAKLISNPQGGFIAVYHHFTSTNFSVFYCNLNRFF